MTNDEARAFCETWFDRLWTKLDRTVIDEMCAVDIRTYGLTGPREGRQQFEEFYQAIRLAFPNGLTFTVMHALASGDSAMVRLHAKGVAGNGRPVEFGGFAQITVQNGVMTEGWNTFDFLGMLEQCGTLAKESLASGIGIIAKGEVPYA